MKKCSLKNKLLCEMSSFNLKTVVLCAILCLVLGIISGFVSGGFDLYSNLCLPQAAPPAFVFPIIWSILYVLIGAATGIIISNRDKCFKVSKSRGLLYFGVMFLLNLLWSPIFFGAELFFVALVVLVAMIVLTFFVVLCYSNISFISALIMFIYWLWLFFAAYLNLAIIFLNS
ncbi:MAG: tryptophan-rich sensory protein [Ruminococcaceae bacterium]|nr:tryptophan-rich sensory protein [Oscillospiraceae bacterium]